MGKFELTTHALDKMATEGTAATSDLCKMAELMGYKDSGRFAINQLQCNNGAFVSSLLRFFEDNPGAVEAVHEWVRKFYDQNMEEAQTEACELGSCEIKNCENCGEESEDD